MGDKRLYKSSENSMLCGVCGGIAEYFGIDPTLVRLAWVILTCLTESSKQRSGLRISACMKYSEIQYKN